MPSKNLRPYYQVLEYLSTWNSINPLEAHTDASDFAIGIVLMQDGHPVAYKS